MRAVHGEGKKRPTRRWLCRWLWIPALIVGGCARPPAAPEPPTAPSAPQPPQMPPALSQVPSDSKLSAAASKSPSVGWNEVIARWWARYQAPLMKPRVTTLQIPPNPIPISHPAYELVATLQGTIADNATAPRAGTFSHIGTPSLQVLAGTSEIFSRTASTFNSTGTIHFGDPVQFPRLSQRRLLVERLENLHQAMQDRQNSAFDLFLNEVADYQANTRADREANWRAALEDSVNASRRSLLTALVPTLPEAEIQLEMINLRLQLLPNVTLTDDERETARARLQFLEARWEAMLHEQANERVRELKQLLEERPRELRQQGEKIILAALEREATHDRNLRVDVRDAQRRRIEVDFAGDNARLGIVQPAANSLHDITTFAGAKTTANTFRTQRLARTSLQAPSLPSFAAIALPPALNVNQRAGFERQIQTARAVANADMEQWQRLARRRAASYRPIKNTAPAAGVR